MTNQNKNALVFSVIIPAFNEQKVISKCLSALQLQTMSRDAFEVLVVDNGSSDNTGEVASGFQGSLNLRVLYTKAPSIAAVRNFGASVASGRFLAFIDADCLAPPHWLERAADLLMADSARVIGAHCGIPDDSSWLARAWYGDRSHLKEGPVSYVPSGDLLVSRDQFVKLRGFDQTIETSEDCDFCQRAAGEGLGIIALPELSVVHLGTPQSFLGFYRQQRWHGNHVLRVFMKDMRKSRVKKPIFYAVYTLCSVTVAAAFLFWGLSTADMSRVALAVVLLVGSPFLMALRTSLVRKKLRLLPSLTLLYLTYGVARAISLLGVKAPGRSGYPGQPVSGTAGLVGGTRHLWRD